MSDKADRLVSNIYLAITDRAKWRSVMSDVTAHLKADSGVFYTHDLKDADGGIWILHNIDEDVMVPYQNYYSGIDTWTNSGIEKKVVDGRLFRSQELIAQDDLRKTEHYNDFLRPNEIEHLIGFAQPTTWNGFTPRVHCSFYKKKGREPFDDSAMQLLQPLHHHLQQALTLQSLVSHSVRSFTARRLVESLCEPAFILDRDFKIVSANSAAEALFRRRDIVACKSGSLVACETRKVLRELLSAFFANEDRLPATGADARHLSSEITVFNVSPVGLNWPDCDRLDHAMVIVRTSCNGAPVNWAAFKAVFGLTAAETKIAHALVSGEDAAAIGKKFGITRETLRTHTKRILCKAGVSRQSDLIRLVYTTFRNPSMPGGEDARP